MGDAGRSGDDRTFRVNFAGEGRARLQEKVKEKLKEILGDYTDDTLVDYVVILVGNGRHKEEAKKELHVFLGEDSDPFVSWLWDHLSQNSHLYLQPKASLAEEAANTIGTSNDHFGNSNTDMMRATFAPHADSKLESEKYAYVPRIRRNREWKGLISEMSGSFPLRSTIIEALKSEEKTSQRPDVKHPSPPRSQVSKKRSREDGRPPTKRDTDPIPKLAPSRRLLEFAVRDAVKTAQQSSFKVEPAAKRLCSVLSTSADTLLDERPQRPRPSLRMPVSVSVALKAAAEAAEDVTKSKNAGSVFDRLGRGKAIEFIDQPSNIKTSFLQVAKNEEFDQSARFGQTDYNQKCDYDEDFTGNRSILDGVSDMVVDSASDNDGYDDFGVSNDQVLDASQYDYSVNKKESSLMLHYNVSKDTDAVVKKTKLVQQEPPPTALANPSSKIVNISVNVNTWKPSDYKVSRNVNEVENQLGEKTERTSVKPNARILNNNTSSISGNDKEMISTDIHKEHQKSQASTPGVSYSTARPSEDFDSRTIFISNVHFAATKDNLSRHFNKFGEVLKVIIVTDPSTSQPIGSAYVEFLRKESAELALSLNGTSFMSRILKVVLRSSGEAHAIGWPRIARASPFTSRLGRMPFPRGILPGAFRARLPVKPGARSMQWKRESDASKMLEGAKNIQNTPVTPRSTSLASVGRNLTYVRPEKT